MCGQKRNHPLLAAFEELLRIQHQLLYRSSYFGELFHKLLGTDTIPFLLMTTDGTILRQSYKALHVATCYFRLEAVEQERIYVSLLRAFNEEDRETNSVRNIARFEKTAAKVWIELRQVSAIQLVDARLLSVQYVVESKW